MSDHDLPPLRRPGPGRDVPRGNGSDDNGPGGSGPGDNGPDDSGPGRATLGRTPRPPYDPSVVVALSLSSPSFLTPADIPALQARPWPTPESLCEQFGVTYEARSCRAADGHGIPLAVFRRIGDDSVGPGFVAIHGGGMIAGDRFSGAGTFLPALARHGGTLISVGYRLAPQYPAPTPVEDCHTALAWVADHARELRLDPSRLLLGGGSAGGGLAAGAMLLARDRGGPALRGVQLACPMLDDRNNTVSTQQFDIAVSWGGRSNAVGWGALLGSARGTDAVSAYDAPARAPWLGGLPPVQITVGSADPFRDEDVAFASAIWRDGGDCELLVLPGGHHGYERDAPDSSITRLTLTARRRWINRILDPDDTSVVVPVPPPA